MNTAAALLVVEDDQLQLRALCGLLRLEGYTVQAAGSAAAALDYLRGQGAALVLTDLHLPDADGLDLLRRARELDSDVAGIVMTGHGAIDSAVNALKEGAQDYLLKPVNPTALVAVIERALQVRQLRLDNQAMHQREREHLAALQAANEDLESFAYSVSHDLRAPLRAIRGFCGIYLQDYGAQIPPEGRQLLDRVVEGAMRMDGLIDALLRFSRCSRQSLVRTEVAMEPMVRRVFDMLSSQAPERQLQLHLGALPACRADPALLEQAVVNLLSNAIKFTRGRSPALIEVSAQQEAGETVYTVRDNGAGFDMQYADKLFAVFQRLHPATQFEGIGVGLSIVQRIIQRHGGRVWACSEPGQGASFHFTLPLEGAPAMDQPEAPAVAPQ